MDGTRTPAARFTHFPYRAGFPSRLRTWGVRNAKARPAPPKERWVWGVPLERTDLSREPADAHGCGWRPSACFDRRLGSRRDIAGMVCGFPYDLLRQRR